ncbi:unnamed protein product, partial [Choristocarpus tenellus]
MEAGTGDMYLRSQLSRKKRQLAEGNICIVQTQPSEYSGIKFLQFTAYHKDKIQWNARHHSSYGGILSAGDEVVFVTENFKVLSASFVDGVPTIHMSRTDKMFTSESNRQSLGGIPARFSRQLRFGDT